MLTSAKSLFPSMATALRSELRTRIRSWEQRNFHIVITHEQRTSGYQDPAPEKPSPADLTGKGKDGPSGGSQGGGAGGGPTGGRSEHPGFSFDRIKGSLEHPGFSFKGFERMADGGGFVLTFRNNNFPPHLLKPDEPERKDAPADVTLEQIMEMVTEAGQNVEFYMDNAGGVSMTKEEIEISLKKNPKIYV